MARDFDTPFMKGIEAELRASSVHQPLLERAARALASALSAQEPDKGGTFHVDADDLRASVIDGRFDLTLLARAVIEAIREPSESMIDAWMDADLELPDGVHYDAPSNVTDPYKARSDWIAMIDALLEEGQPDTAMARITLRGNPNWDKPVY